MGSDPALEALFPEAVGGKPLEVASMAGEYPISDPESVAAVSAVLATLGKTFDDMTFAFGVLPTGSVTAIRVAGADAAAFAEPLIEVVQGADLEMLPAQVAGKDVIHVPSILAYVYPSDDVAWIIQLEEPALTEVIAALP